MSDIGCDIKLDFSACLALAIVVTAILYLSIEGGKDDRAHENINNIGIGDKNEQTC